MCLITVAPQGVGKKVSDLESFIRNGMFSNDDGSGIAWKQFSQDNTNTIHLKKGFKTATDLLSYIEKIDLKEEDELIIHHRIGTSGLKNEINMHPFIVTSNLDILNSTEGEFNLPAICHNGIFYKYNVGTDIYSDTHNFVRGFISDENILNILKKIGRAHV